MADYKIPYEDAWNDVDGVDIETVPMQDKNISGFEDKDYYTNLFKYLMRDLTDNEKWVITKKFGLDGEEPLDGEELRIAYNQKFGTNYKHCQLPTN